MALPDYTTQDATTYKTNIDSTAADHNNRIVTLEGNNTPVRDYITTTTGTNIDLDLTVPSWVNKIIFSVNGMRCSSTGNVSIIMGTSANWETTGYLATCQKNAASTSNFYSANGFIFLTGITANVSHSGHIMITRADTGSNVWIFSSVTGQENANISYNSWGRKSLASNLGRLRISTSATAFSLGGIGFVYEP